MGKSHAPTPFTSVYRHFFTTMSTALSQAPTFFERERKLGPLQVLLTMQAAHVAGSHAGGQSWENALESVASSLGEDTAWGKRFSVSRTAFAQAVKKVDDAAQVDLWDMCRSLFPAAVGSTLSELHGIRFAHVDGTQVRTARSPELVKTVGVQSNGPSASAHYPSGKWVLVLEAGTQRILGHELCRCKAFDEEQEPVLAREERDGWNKLRDETLKSHAIIADCGFASYAEFADMIDEKQHFLIAVPKSWHVVRTFKARKQADATIEIPVPGDPKRMLTVRVFTIKDADGRTRYIATSLPATFTRSECRRLYKTRWAIETWFRYAKQFLALRRLRSTTLHGVRLELLAILILMQAIAALRARIAHHLNHITGLLCSMKEGFRKANFIPVLRCTWRTCCTALANPTDERIPITFTRLFNRTNPYRPGRRYQRISKDPAGVFMPKRPSQSQRKAAVNAAVLC
jgi:hypothetical protein